MWIISAVHPKPINKVTMYEANRQVLDFGSSSSLTNCMVALYGIH